MRQRCRKELPASSGPRVVPSRLAPWHAAQLLAKALAPAVACELKLVAADDSSAGAGFCSLPQAVSRARPAILQKDFFIFIVFMPVRASSNNAHCHFVEALGSRPGSVPGLDPGQVLKINQSGC